MFQDIAAHPHRKEGIQGVWCLYEHWWGRFSLCYQLCNCICWACSQVHTQVQTNCCMNWIQFYPTLPYTDIDVISTVNKCWWSKTETSSLSGSQGVLEPNTLSFTGQTNTNTHTHTSRGLLASPVHLTHMPLGYWRKPELPAETPGYRGISFTLWGPWPPLI